MRIKYPENLYCPHCKSTIHLDYSDKTHTRTDDLLITNIKVPHSNSSVKDAQKNKQNINDALIALLICKNCHTIFGTYNRCSY